MRKEAKETINPTITNIQSYHQGGHGTEEYAFAGFRVNKYYTSDRYELLDEYFRRPNGAPLQGYGLEIETECNGIISSKVLAEVYNKIIFTHFPEDLFKLQRDGSLGGRTSAECITQVMTKSAIRNNYKAFMAMYNTYFPEFNIKADSEETHCGMHVNISNACFGKTLQAQETAIRKLYYIVNKHYNLCCNLFYRKGSHTYCGQMNYAIAKTMNLHGRYADHGVCFNLGHFDSGRIELRLPGGQKNYACFRNTMESVFFLVERVRNISWADCDRIEKIFEGCNQYVYSRLTICGLDYLTLNKIHDTVKTVELL